MRPTILFDLDGPILDVRRRHWAAHRDCAAELGVTNPFRTAASYWAAKRRRATSAELLASDDAATHVRYRELLAARIEADDLLPLDEPQPGVATMLGRVSRRMELVVVTLRRRRSATLAQLDRLGLGRFFAACHVSAGSGKTSLVRRLQSRRDCLAVVGDTEVDAEAANANGIPFIATSYGIRRATLLREFSPAAVVNHPTRLSSALKPFVSRLQRLP